MTQFYGWLKEQVRKYWPNTPVCAGTHHRLAFNRFGAIGVDMEQVNEQINDVLQCETVYGLPTRKAAAHLPDYGMDIFAEAGLDFQRSLSGKPAVDLEFHAWLNYVRHLHKQGKILQVRYTSAAIYRHFLHGIRAANIWVWNRKPQSSEM